MISSRILDVIKKIMYTGGDGQRGPLPYYLGHTPHPRINLKKKEEGKG